MSIPSGNSQANLWICGQQNPPWRTRPSIIPHKQNDWVIHSPVGRAVIPARWTRRVPCSMKNSITYKRRRNTVSTWKKSAARIVLAWVSRPGPSTPSASAPGRPAWPLCCADSSPLSCRSSAPPAHVGTQESPSTYLTDTAPPPPLPDESGCSRWRLRRSSRLSDGGCIDTFGPLYGNDQMFTSAAAVRGQLLLPPPRPARYTTPVESDTTG